MANPADTTSVSFPDLMFVNSKITSPKTLSTETFFEWYDEDHIPDVYDSGKVGGAWRYFDVQEDTERPYLALYDIDNVTFRTSPNFAAIRVTSAVLPGTGAIFDMADFDIRFYSRTQLYEPAGTKPGRAHFLMVVEIEPGSDITDDEFDRWYRNDHLQMLSKCDGYRRSIRYQLDFATQNRNDPQDSTLAYPLRLLSLHEWDTDELNQAQLDEANTTEWAKKILASAKFNLRTFSLKKEFLSSSFAAGKR